MFRGSIVLRSKETKLEKMIATRRNQNTKTVVEKNIWFFLSFSLLLLPTRKIEQSVKNYCSISMRACRNTRKLLIVKYRKYIFNQHIRRRLTNTRLKQNPFTSPICVSRCRKISSCQNKNSIYVIVAFCESDQSPRNKYNKYTDNQINHYNNETASKKL